MIKSLKGANGSFAQLGNPQVQAQTDDLAYAAKKGTKTPASQNSPGTSPAHETGLQTSVIKHTGESFDISQGASLSDIVSALSTDSTFLLPPFHSTQNHIIPSFATQFEPIVVRAHSTAKLTEFLASKKFEPYEQLTGIAHERPEIVMLTNFLPLFNKDVSHAQPSFGHLLEAGGVYPFMTDAGQFVDTHVNARALRQVNMIKLLRSLVSNFGWLYNVVNDRQGKFEKQMDSLKTTTNWLLQLVRSLEQMKGQLDLRDDLHTTEPQQVAQQHIANVTAVSLDVSHAIINLLKLYLPPSYTITDTLVRLGYKRENINQKYSSTKIWLQLMYELKQILRYHSLEFLDIDPVTARNDDKASRLSKSSTKLFSVPPNSQLANLQTISTANRATIGPIHTALTAAWKKHYRDVHFKTTEAHVAALINFVSKEFRCSYGLGKVDVQNALKDQYGYNVTPNANSDVFESIVGPIGNTMTDFPATQGKSLTAMAQRTPSANVAVMTFESKYIDGDTGTLSPGASYFFDQVLKTDGKTFDTSKLDDLTLLFENAHDRFSTIVEGMNLLGHQVSDPNDVLYTQYSSVLSNPADFVRTFLKEIVNVSFGKTTTDAANDNLGAIFSYAVNHSQVKTTLFLITMARILSTEPTIHLELETGNVFDGFETTLESTPLINVLIDRLVAELEQTVPQTQTGNQFIRTFVLHETFSISKEMIKTSLKVGTKLTNHIESIMKSVINAFKHEQDAMINQRSRFNGYGDTVIAMILFDALLMMVAKYNNQSIVSQNHGLATFVNPQDTITFNIKRTTTLNRTSIQDLLTRLEKEVAMTQSVIYATFNSLQKLSNSSRNYSNYLKSPTSTSKLKELALILNNNDMLQMLMSEQQIMMLASTVHDLVDKISQPGNVVMGNDAGDADGDNDFDASDQFKLLDDSVVLPRLRNAIYGLFGTQGYAQQKGFNKRILTVGIPLGFTQRMKQRIKINDLKQSSFVNKQNDIIQIVVYKVDMENSDIVYKPQRFLFELSRFPVRNDRYFLSIPERPSIDDIVHAIPTRDFGQNAEQGSEITYWSLRTDDIPKDKVAAFAEEEYSFLSQHEKAELARNHVVSFMMEVYIKLLTGLSIADYHFDMVPTPKPMETDFVKLLVDHHISLVSKLGVTNQLSDSDGHPPTGGVLFSTTSTPSAGFTASTTTTAPKAETQPSQQNSTGITGTSDAHVQFSSISTDPVTKTVAQQKAIGTTASNLSKISHRDAASVLHGLRTISNMAHTLSALSDPLNVSKKIVTPKQFDRVFNVPIDPDDFEVDYEKTVKSLQGVQALNQLIQKGDIILASENDKASTFLKVGSLTVPAGSRIFVQNRSTPNIHHYRRQERDKNEGDLTLDKYFVTVETFGEEEV